MRKYIIDDIESSFDSDRENLNEETSDEENSDEGNQTNTHIIYITHMVKFIFTVYKKKIYVVFLPIYKNVNRII